MRAIRTWSVEAIDEGRELNYRNPVWIEHFKVLSCLSGFVSAWFGVQFSLLS
jgi:hypothetical protein